MALALIELTRLADRENLNGRAAACWCLLFGVAAGLGLENKWNEVFFLLAGLLMTKQRRVLASKWFPIAFAVMLLLILPNLLWEAHRHWPTLELLHNNQINGKNVQAGPLSFVLIQIADWGPMIAPIPIPGSQVNNRIFHGTPDQANLDLSY